MLPSTDREQALLYYEIILQYILLHSKELAGHIYLSQESAVLEIVRTIYCTYYLATCSYIESHSPKLTYWTYIPDKKTKCISPRWVHYMFIAPVLSRYACTCWCEAKSVSSANAPPSFSQRQTEGKKETAY